MSINQSSITPLKSFSNRLHRCVSRPLLIFVCCVVGGAAIVETAFWWAGLLGPFVGMLVVPILMLAGAVIAVSSIYRAWKRRGTDAREGTIAATSIIGVVLSPIIFVATMWLGGWLFDWTWLATHQSAYSKIIALAQINRLPPPGKTAFQTFSDGTDFQAERKSPSRIAFPFPGGFLNNWQGILYDPSGVGLRINAVQKDGKPGDLLDSWWTIGRCSHMVGNYFSCSFS